MLGHRDDGSEMTRSLRARARQVQFVNTFVKGYYHEDEDDALAFVKEHTVSHALSALGCTWRHDATRSSQVVSCHSRTHARCVFAAQEYSVAHCRGLIMNGIAKNMKKKNVKIVEEKLNKLLRFRT